MHAVNYCKSCAIQQLAVLALFLPGCTNVALVSVSRDACVVLVFGPIEMHGNGSRN